MFEEPAILQELAVILILLLEVFGFFFFKNCSLELVFTHFTTLQDALK